MVTTCGLEATVVQQPLQNYPLFGVKNATLCHKRELWQRSWVSGVMRRGHRASEQNELVSGKTPVGKPPARTSESNCWQINGHMVDWLPLAWTHTHSTRLCVCERMCPNYHLSGSVPPSQHSSPSPLLPLPSSLFSGWGISQPVSLSSTPQLPRTQLLQCNTRSSPKHLTCLTTRRLCERVRLCAVAHKSPSARPPSHRPFISTHPGRAAAL